MGYQVEETPHGIWIGISHGFFNRVPLYETAPPTQGEIRSLFRCYPILGLHYALPPGSRGKPSYGYFVRDRDYDLKHLHRKSRKGVRRGLENCQVRPMGFDELYHLGPPLNRDTLARQGRDDPTLSQPERWARFCQAGEQVEGAQVWGAFVSDELAAYVTLFRIDGVVNLLHQNSRTSLMKLYPNPALNFTVTQNMMRTPGVQAVFSGPAGHWSSPGLDAYKRHMGYLKDPVVFAVQLRPVVKHLLLSQWGRRIISALGCRLSGKTLCQSVKAILEVAVLSL